VSSCPVWMGASALSDTRRPVNEMKVLAMQEWFAMERVGEKHMPMGVLSPLWIRKVFISI